MSPTPTEVPAPSLLTQRPTSSPAPQSQSRLRLWLRAIRYSSFTASIIPIVVGSSLALVARSFDIGLFIVMLLASVACHAGANLANDYFDYLKGVDTADPAGPQRVIPTGLLTASEVRNGMIVAFATATALGFVIVWQTGWEIFVLALVSLGAAYFYTGGPKPLGYIALGEPTVFIFMGLVMVGGSYYVHTQQLSWLPIVVSLPIAFLAAAILHANNLRDIESDRRAGKVTLATVLGRPAADVEYLVLVGGAFIAVTGLIAWQPRFWPTAIAGLAIPRAVQLVMDAFAARETPQLNRLLRKTAGLHLWLGTLLAIGLIIRAVFDRI
ncbi:MAG TPA: 1,4-dihydroxy-2-naphthoate octaprenyltransferase [Thermomicrobiales bacterium]|mgnify:CR=1 FL=1